MFVIRVALIGDGAVGKTCIRKRYMGEGFLINYQATIGADFATKRTTIDDKEFRFQIWDLAGQPLYSAVREIYYQGCMGGLAVYDCTRRPSYDNIIHWVQDLWKHCNMGDIPIILLGNKSDLMEEFPDSITLEEGERLVEHLQTGNTPIHFLPTSAKTGQNIEEAFNFLGRTIISYFKEKMSL